MVSVKRKGVDLDTEKIKRKIVRLFNKNVRGRFPNVSKSNIRHDGKGGHWLETQMGVNHNASNTPDLFGFEMKNFTKSKTTFGDWSADYYIFKDYRYGINRDDFLRIFGAPNEKKKGRYSWSGKPVPKIDGFNFFGQRLEVDKYNNISAVYSFDEDQRIEKHQLVPSALQKKRIVIASWSSIMMKARVERKFNNRGWFKCVKNDDGVYTEIKFGDPLAFSSWIKGVRKGVIFFDSGMYEGNARPYSQWRADNKYWDSLIVDSY